MNDGLAPHAAQSCRVGVISDTHGLMRPEALAALSGCRHIVHAGDIGPQHIIDQLERIAPVVAVRGNNDPDGMLPLRATLNIGAFRIHVLHDRKELLKIDEAESHIVISGHSHVPSITRSGPVLFINPGSAGPRRFKLPVSLALLEFRGAYVEASIVNLWTARSV